MSIQQQQGDEERRRRDEEEAYESACKASLALSQYADKRTIIPPSHGYGNYGPDLGVDGSFGYRERLYQQQLEQNAAISQRAKERK